MQVALAKSDAQLAIETVSNRADLISGGDALVRLTLPHGLARSGKMALELNGQPLVTTLNDAPDGRGYPALIKGMKPGHNELTLSVPGRSVQLEPPRSVAGDAFGSSCLRVLSTVARSASRSRSAVVSFSSYKATVSFAKIHRWPPFCLDLQCRDLKRYRRETRLLRAIRLVITLPAIWVRRIRVSKGFATVWLYDALGI